jgi:hydrogen cyanide synthase HcnC
VKARAYDIVVIGGGLVGAAIAYGLADPSRRVAMLDEGDHALSAARGNFGLIWVQGKGIDFPAYAAWTRESARRWAELAARLREETGIDVALEQRGGVHLCLSERELAARTALVARARASTGAVAQGIEMIDRAALMKLLPGIGPEVAGASYGAEDGHVDPLRLLRALHAAFVARGGSIFSECAVRSVTFERGSFALTTATGPIDAARVVLAAGLGNATLAPQLGLSAPVRGQRGQIIALERRPPLLPLPVETLRQTGEGTVLAGDSQEETASTDTSTGVLSAIAARAVRAFPQLAEARVVRCWAALRVLSPDRLPIYQQSRTAPGAFIATCHSGVTLAAAHALDLAPQIVAGTLTAALLPFSTDRFDVAPAT